MTQQPKVSIISACYNAEGTLQDTIDSIVAQDYPNIEYIVMDGVSKDGTLEILKANQDKIQVLVSEPDEGFYNAINKGISLATGEIIALLNSDDLYVSSQVVSKMVACLQEKAVDSVFADVVYVDQADTAKLLRYYSSKGNWNVNRFQWGLMPAHPTFFTYKKTYETFGLFREDLKIAADFDILLRFLGIHQISRAYLPEPIIKMRVGGLSSSGLSSKIQISQEIALVLKSHQISVSWAKLWGRYAFKILQFLPNLWSKSSLVENNPK
ncbi:MAG: glycosyltransferase family 2 protein [SAR324 cluster bacterium]|nr:glycosyltransferase family 2 protein [SAR324 cluster bacterium]